MIRAWLARVEGASDTAIEGTMRWQYGKVVKVFTGGELVDINLDSGEELRATPTFDVDAVQ